MTTNIQRIYNALLAALLWALPAAAQYTPAELGTQLWLSNHLSINTYETLLSNPGEITDPTTASVNLFNPTSLDFDEYCRTARNLGASGVVITTKHVDGFCLWPSEVTDGGTKRTIVESGWYQKNGQRNVLLEFCTKARQHGLRVGYYFAIWDEFLESHYGGDPGDVGSEIYTAWCIDQLTEILDSSVYGAIDFVILDGLWDPLLGFGGVNFDEVDYDEIYDAMKAIQPDCLVIVNDHEDGSEGTLHGEVSLWERSITGEPEDNEITNFTGGMLWDPVQRAIAPADHAWFDHTDADAMVSSDAALPIGRQFRMHNLAGVPVGYILNVSSYPDGRLASDTLVMLNEMLAPAGTQVAVDNFSPRATESLPINLQSHTALDATTWTKTFGAESAAINEYGRLRVSSNLGVVYKTSGTSGGIGQRTVIDFMFASVPASGCEVTAMCRINGGATTDYRLSTIWNGSTWVIGLKKNNSGITVLSTATVADADEPSTSKKYRIAVEARGSEIRGELWIDASGTGSDYRLWGKLFATDSAIAGPGSCGFYLQGTTSSASTGVQLERFQALDVDVTVPTAPTLQYASPRDNGIALRWTTTASEVLVSEVWRSAEGATAEHVGDSTSSEFLDETAVSGVRYDYYVLAVDRSFNRSVASNVIRSSWSATAAIHDSQTAVDQIAELNDGSHISAAFVGPARVWRFDNTSQTTAPNIVSELKEFDATFRMDLTNAIPRNVALRRVVSVTISPTANVVEPVLGTASLTPDKRQIDIPIDAKNDEEGEGDVTARTYTVRVQFETTDSQILSREGSLAIAP